MSEIVNRIKGEKYLYQREIRQWNGYMFLCVHDKRQSQCIQCESNLNLICERQKRITKYVKYKRLL